MERMSDSCNFQTFIRLLYGKIKSEMNPFDPNRKAKQEDLIYALFYSYYEDHDTVCSQSIGSQYFNGQLGVPNAIKHYYQNLPNQDKLREDIELNIIPWLVNIEDTVSALIKLIHDAAEIGEGQYRELAALQHDPADFVAQITLHAMRQKHIPPKPAELAKSQSGVLTDARRHRPPQPCPYFCGRERELAMLFALLQSQHCVFVRGIDGIGKSEFVKKFATEYQNAYDVRFFYYNNSLADTFSELGSTENAIIDALHEISPNVLLIVDNFNPDELNDPLLFSFSDLSCRVLFTTPCAIEDVTAYELKEMSEDELLTVFAKNYSETEHHHFRIRSIIRVLHGHTMSVVLAARLLQRGIITPERVYWKLTVSRVSSYFKEKIGFHRNKQYRTDTYFGHIAFLFRMCKLTDEQQTCLRYSCFLPEEGINTDFFFFLFHAYEQAGTLTDLEYLGLIRQDSEHVISMHPLLADLVMEDLKPAYSNCTPLINNLKALCINRFSLHKDPPELHSILRNVIQRMQIDDNETAFEFLMDASGYLQDRHDSIGENFANQRISEIGSNLPEHQLHIYFSHLASNTMQKQEYGQAEALFQKAGAYLLEGADPLQYATWNANMALCQSGVGDLTSAMKYYEKALVYYNQAEPKGEVLFDKYAAMMSYALLMRRTQLPHCIEASIDLLQKGLQVLRSKGVPEDCLIAKFEFELGLSYLKAKHMKTFQEHTKRAFEIFNEIYPKSSPELVEYQTRMRVALENPDII